MATIRRGHSVSEVSELSDLDAITNGIQDLVESHQNVWNGNNAHRRYLLVDAMSQVKSSDPRSSTPFIPQHDKEEGSGSGPIFAEPLERQPWALWLLSLYAIAAVPSWAVTGWLSFRPIGISAYDDVQTAEYPSLADWDHNDRWRRAANIGLSIVAAVGIPVTSAICAKATVIYCQMKSKGKPPSLTMRQTMALADKGWSDLSVIWDLMHPTRRRRTRSPLLLF